MSVANGGGEVKKAGSRSVDEEFLEVPAALLKSKNGFSFDMGGSCIKLVYSLGEKGKAEDSIVIRMTTYDASQLEEAMKFLKERFGDDIGRGQTVFTTGVGCHNHSNLISSTLNIRLETVSEMDCFVKAFRFLVSNFPINRITHDQSSVVTEYRDRIMKQIQTMYLSQLSLAEGQGSITGQRSSKGDVDMVKGQLDDPKKSGVTHDCVEKNGSNDLLSEKTSAAVKEPDVAKSETIKDPYPCMLSMMGSGGAIIKTFDELIDLASRGNEENVMVLVKQLKSGTGSDAYSVMPDDVMAFCFGQAVGRNIDEFKKEDLAAALLSTIGQDLAQTTHLNSLVMQTNTIYFCGSFAGQSQLVRDTIGRYFSIRSSSSTGQPKAHHFLRFGGYLGALGCLIDNMNH